MGQTEACPRERISSVRSGRTGSGGRCPPPAVPLSGRRRGSSWHSSGRDWAALAAAASGEPQETQAGTPLASQLRHRGRPPVVMPLLVRRSMSRSHLFAGQLVGLADEAVGVHADQGIVLDGFHAHPGLHHVVAPGQGAVVGQQAAVMGVDKGGDGVGHLLGAGHGIGGQGESRRCP